MSDIDKKNDGKTLLTEGHQPLQKGHTATNLSNIGDTPPTGGSGLVSDSNSSTTSSTTSESSSNTNSNSSSTNTNSKKE